MNRAERRYAGAYIRRESQKYPETLAKLSPAEWSDKAPPDCTEVWRSRGFLVQIYASHDPAVIARLSVCRAGVKSDGGWEENIQWEELQRLKRECGFKNHFAIEVYPAEKDVVNVANMRHLWVLADAPSYAWRRP